MKHFTSKDFHVGQTVYVEYTGRHSYGNVENPLPGVVSKVGKKYITLEDKRQFIVDTGLLKSDYSSDYRLHLSIEDYNQQKQLEEMLKLGRAIFDFYPGSNLHPIYFLTDEEVATLSTLLNEAKERKVNYMNK